MLAEPANLSGAFTLNLFAARDARGTFVKTFNDAAFKAYGIDFELKESYYSFSSRDVIRGMHFQLPPYQHSKVVFCPKGAILDVIVDLRTASPTFGQWCAVELSETNNKAMYIPEGFAHGFKALSDDAMTYYLVSSGYEKDADTGILYNSFGFDWQVDNPLLSSRDLSFGTLEEFKSPF